MSPERVGNFTQAGNVEDIAWVSTPSGVTVVPSKAVKELIEDSPYELVHTYRTFIGAMSGKVRPPQNPGVGKEWVFVPEMREWQARPKVSWSERQLQRLRGLGLN